MIKKSIAAALALGFFAFTLSVLPVTPAQAQCVDACSCFPPYTDEQARATGAGQCEGKGGVMRYCCKPKPVTKTLPVNPCEAEGPGYEYSAKAGRCVQTLKPSQLKAACEKKGPNYTYDLDTGGCVKTIAKVTEETCQKRAPTTITTQKQIRASSTSESSCPAPGLSRSLGTVKQRVPTTNIIRKQGGA
jgi:hypothetical protein